MTTIEEFPLSCQCLFACSLRIEGVDSHHNKQSYRGDELVALEWWIVEIMFAKDTLSGAEAFNKG